MKHIILFLLFTFSINSAFADSPLTSTDFYKAYMDVPMVQDALNCKGKITNEMLEFIYIDTNPLEVKLAIINAVGWKVSGLKNSRKFFSYVMNKKKYKKEFGGAETAFNWNASADELICYAYMKALDNYFDVVESYNAAGLALDKNPNSFAVNMIYNLIKAQGMIAFGETCYMKNLFHTLKTNTNLQMDMKKESMSYVFEYMEMIGVECKTN